MKRTSSEPLEALSARNATPLHEANIVAAPALPDRMPIDLLDLDDLARFTRIRAMNFDIPNLKQEFGIGVPLPNSDFVSFVTSREIPTDKYAVWALLEYVLSEFPVLAITLFQVVNPTDLSLVYTSEKTYLNLMKALNDFPGLRELHSYDNTIHLTLLLKFIGQNNSVSEMSFENTEAEETDVEAITSAFAKNSTLQYLSLGPVQGLDEEQLDCLAQAVAHHPTITFFELLLDTSWHDDQLTDAIVMIITQNSCLKTLVMDAGCASEGSIEKIADALKWNKTIQHLDCKIPFDSLSKEALTALRNGLKMNETLLTLTDPHDDDFDAFMQKESDLERKILFGSIAALLKRNALFSESEVIEHASGACAGFVVQLGLPPKLGSIVGKYLTMKERLALTNINNPVLATALAYEQTETLRILADGSSTSDDAD